MFPHNSTVMFLVHMTLHVTKVSKVHVHPQNFPHPPYALFSTKVVLPTDKVQPAYILVTSGGKIHAVTDSLPAIPKEWRKVIVDVSPLVVMPGLIDPHVHINEPGREHWEGFYHASKAAAAGGTTTILDMPINNIPSTISADTLALKVQALANTNAIVDIGLIGGIVHGNTQDIQGLLRGGVIAMKSFMINSQSPDFPHVTEQDISRAVQELKRIFSQGSDNNIPIPYILHAELDDGKENTGDRLRQNSFYDHFSYDDFEKSQPVSWETSALEMATRVANHSGIHIHIAHVSSHKAVEKIADLLQSPFYKARLTAETCPHYLLWEKENIAHGSVLLKCSPPIRSADNRRKMALSVFGRGKHENVIEAITSDHSPCPVEMKQVENNLTAAWGGIAGLQHRLQGSWTAAETTNNSIVGLAKLLSEGPSNIFGLQHLKGSFRSGLDADMVIWDPEIRTTLTQAGCHHRHNTSAFHNMKVRGTVFYTILRGEGVYIRSKKGDMEETFRIGKGRLLVRSGKNGSVQTMQAKEWRISGVV